MFLSPFWNWLKRPSRTSKDRRTRVVRDSRQRTLHLEVLEDRTLLSASWSPIGPASIDNGFGAQPVAGRITGLAADPTDANTVYITAAGGGVWKTTDAEDAKPNWTPLTDSQSTLFMGSIGIAKGSGVNGRVLYAGTGEANNSGHDTFYGRGILVSKDSGQTWTLTGNGVFNRSAIGTIVVDPSDATGDTAYAAVSGIPNNGIGGGFTNNYGIWKTTDGGTTWSNMTSGTVSPSGYNPFSSLVMDPNNSQILYAAVGGIFGSGSSTGQGVYETTNGGTTWTKLGGFSVTANTGRIALAEADVSGTPTLYASVQDASQATSSSFGSTLEILKSTNSGTNWTPVMTGPDSGLGQSANYVNYMGGQGWYDQTIAIDPKDNTGNTVYVMGQANLSNYPNQGILETKNGGTNWTDISVDNTTSLQPHVDHHAIGFDANNNLLDGNDGGLWRLNNPTPGSISWSDLNGNLNITQFTGIALDPKNTTGTGYVVFGGSQDNGTEASKGTQAWQAIYGGDGGFVRVDPNNPKTVYTENFGVSLAKSNDGGNTFTSVSNGIVGNAPPDNMQVGQQSFYIPYVIDPASSRIVLGTTEINESSNGGASWTQIGVPGSNGFNPGNDSTGTPAGATAIATQGNTTYVAMSDGTVWITTNNGSSWKEINPIAGFNPFSPGGYQDIEIDPADASGQTAYIATAQFSGDLGGLGRHIFKTTNGGTTWTDLSFANGLPDLPVWSLAIDDADNTVFAGTDNGVYASVNGGAWSQFGTGMPNVEVTGLQYDATNQILAAGTHGRGMWEITTATAPTVTAISPTTGPLTGTSVTITGTNLSNATAVMFGATAGTITANPNGTSITVTAPAESAGTVDVTVTTAGGTSVTSSADQFTYLAAPGAPTVTAISPTSGPLTGTSVTITGTNLSSATAVMFGATAGTITANPSATSITVTAPPEVAGTVDVTVTTAGGTSVTSSADQFTYAAVPTVTSISPTSGPLTGTSVTITGTNLSNATTVMFGATAGTITANPSATSITVTAPPEVAGIVDVTVTTAGGTSAISNADKFTYAAAPAAPTVTAISPTSGPLAGTSVTITGTNLSSATAVMFGTTAGTITANPNGTSITVTAPAESAGTVDVTVTTAGGTSATSSADQFTYVAAPTVTGIAPSTGPLAGTSVTITGTNLSSATAVNFGATAGTITANPNGTSITVTAPPEVAGIVDVTVTTAGGTSAISNADKFTYAAAPAAPTVTSITPSTGPLAGTTVTITGTNLSSATAVMFGATAGTITANSATSITVTAPAESAGTVDVTVTTAGGTSATSSADQFTYVAVPTVTAISPTTGPLAGTSVTITGTNLSSATAVNFGATAGTITANSATSITVTAPAESAGTVDVTVTTAGGTSAISNADKFTYAAAPAAPTVTAISPTTGPLAGTSVTITGTNLSSATAVMFGATAGTITANSATSITVTAPAESAGTVDVTVTTAGGTSVTSSADQFTYLAAPGAPTVTAISPTSGPLTGTSVTITGTNLSSATAVMFGATAGTITANPNGTSITVTAPAESAGTVDVTVTTAGGTSVTSSADQFTYVAVPTVTAISPSTGPLTGTSVTITGTNLSNATAVMFGATAGTITANPNGTSITVTAPAESAGTVDVTVTTAGGTSVASNADKFTYAAAPAAIVSGVSVEWGKKGDAQLFTAGDGLRLLPAGRLTDLPWLNINRFVINLNQAATLNPGDISVTGITVGNYGVASVTRLSPTSYLVTLNTPISLPDRVTISVGNAQISSFTRRLDVLPGDVNDDGAVNIQDLVVLARMFVFGLYRELLPFAEFDGIGYLDATDYILASLRYFSHHSTLP